MLLAVPIEYVHQMGELSGCQSVTVSEILPGTHAHGSNEVNPLAHVSNDTLYSTNACAYKRVNISSITAVLHVSPADHKVQKTFVQ